MISPIQDIIADLKAGKIVVLVDEEDRENEGDLVMAAEFVTPDAINFMAKFGRGLICLTLTDARCKQLGLRQMVSDNQTPHGTAFTVSIEAAEGVTTGISAADRSVTIQAAVAKHAQATDIIQPGHIFPLRAQPGGVLVRAGHTEAGCDLSALAGLEPASVICEILKDDGTMARLPDLIVFAKEHGLKIGTIVDLIHYRSQTEMLVERVAERQVATIYGEFQLIAYRDKTSNELHLAMVKGVISPEEETLVRVHEPLSVIDFLDDAGSPHSWNVHQALKAISEVPSGVVVFFRRPESTESLLARIEHAVHKPSAKVDLRDYGIGAQILRDLNVRKMRLLAAPRKMPSLEGFDLEVCGYVLPQDWAQATNIEE
ncbi:MAG: 3,4-dihydroxy-2-butanone-4-phosphate synthase [Burkholderiales bacterium]|nr:3,4-dihydroxy-2-butanone-4-phosphate synthase [Burkholderiales bacterium]